MHVESWDDAGYDERDRRDGSNFDILRFQPPVEHESLMLDRGDQKLSEEEKREAKRNYEREKKLMKQSSNSGIDWKRVQLERTNKPSFSE